ncbi:MAG TPA: NmrA family NAD(P)-binding protein [Terracidiphilus sp.]
MSILVVGGTGRVGGAAALTLAKRGFMVTALVRGGRNHPGSTHLLDAGIFVVDGDLRRRETLRSALDGVETIICSATAMPAAHGYALERVDHQGTLALMEAAEASGVKRFIYVSYSTNIRWDSPLETAKRDGESFLLRSKMEAVILRPSFFMEVWLSPALGFDPAAGSVRIYGPGDAKISYISSSNVADFAANVATGELYRKNMILELGGPEDLSQLEVVSSFEKILGRQMKLDYVPVETLRTQHESHDPLQKTFAALMLAYAGGDVVLDAVNTARRHGIRLCTVAEYATHFQVPQVVS